MRRVRRPDCAIPPPRGYRAGTATEGRRKPVAAGLRNGIHDDAVRTGFSGLPRQLHVNLIEEHTRESVEKGIILVDTEGEAIGQVNGLSVLDLGDISFGQPSRITATIGIGREGIFDLLREASQRRNVKLREIADEVALTGEPPKI